MAIEAEQSPAKTVASMTPGERETTRRDDPEGYLAQVHDEAIAARDELIAARDAYDASPWWTRLIIWWKGESPWA